MFKRKQQAGVALITALLVVSLATILAVSLVSHLNYDISRTNNILNLDRALLGNNVIMDAAKQLLHADRKLNNFDTLVEADFFDATMYAAILESSPVENGTAEVFISDLQSCFNLNNVVQADGNTPNTDATSVYTALLRNINFSGLENPPNIPQLVGSLVDWIDSNQDPQPGGAEFDYYLGLEIPYRVADAPLASKSELRLIQGYNEDVYNRLNKFVCVLPATATPSNININTASAEVLQSYGLEEKNAKDLIEYREAETDETSSPFDTQAKIKQQIDAYKQTNNIDSGNFQANTNYFLITSKISLGGSGISGGDEEDIKDETTTFYIYSVIYRDDKTVSILRQTRNEI